VKLDQEAIGLLGAARRQRVKEAVDLRVDRLHLLGMVALDVFLKTTGNLLDGGTAQVRGEAQQILDAEVLLAAEGRAKMAADGRVSCLEGWPQSAKVTPSASKLVPELVPATLARQPDPIG
jgi:hypothetical protein